MSFRNQAEFSLLQLIFTMTAHIIACGELAENEADLKKIAELFMIVQDSATPISLLLPWFPNSAKKAKKQANMELYTMVYPYVETRRHTEPTTEAMDIMIAEGATTHDVVSVSLSLKTT